MRLLFITLFTLILTLSCEEEKREINTNDVIKSVEVMDYEKLTFNYANLLLEKETFRYGCYCYPNGNWRDLKEFKKEDAFFVKVKLNNRLLAELSESETFSKEYLLNPEDANFLYGKYHNRWKFFDSFGTLICETEKFEGYEIIDINRNGNFDEVIIGPLVKKPAKMEIEILDSKYYPNITPKFQIK